MLGRVMSTRVTDSKKHRPAKSKPAAGISRRLVKGTYVAASGTSTGMFAALVKAMALNNKPRREVKR